MQGFLETWHLFAEAYLAAWTVAALLGALGVFVVARDQIFLGAALSQASTFGVMVAVALGAAGHAAHGGTGWWAVPAAMCGAVGATLLIRYAQGDRGQTAEALTGWVFLGASAGSVLLAAGDPRGGEQVHRLMASSFIGADWNDVRVLAGVLVGVALTLGVFRRTLLLVTIDPLGAAVQGVRAGRWQWALDLGIAVCVALAMRTTGMLYAFGCLVLPAMTARNLCRRSLSMFWAAPLFAVCTAVVAAIIAHHKDWPPAQATVALMVAMWVPSALWRRFRDA